MNLGNAVRVVTVTAACFAAVGSATSNQNSQQEQSPQYATNSAPPPQQMDPGRALGLWRSTFGAVKIEADNRNGGLQVGAVQGIWMYQRAGQDVVGYFEGTLRGNVLQFKWNEPGNPPLNGEGYLQFDQSGRQYSGRWWSDKRDRVGDWNGWRQNAQPAQGNYAQGYGQQQQYGGQGYGAYPQQPQRYPQQPQRYPQQYPQQGQYPQQQPQQYPQQYPQQGQYPQQYPQQQPQYPQQQQQPQQPPPDRPYY